MGRTTRRLVCMIGNTGWAVVGAFDMETEAELMLTRPMWSREIDVEDDETPDNPWTLWATDSGDLGQITLPKKLITRIIHAGDVELESA